MLTSQKELIMNNLNVISALNNVSDQEEKVLNSLLVTDLNEWARRVQILAQLDADIEQEDLRRFRKRNRVTIDAQALKACS